MNINRNGISSTVEANILNIVASFGQVIKLKISAGGGVTRAIINTQGSLVLALKIMATVRRRIEAVT